MTDITIETIRAAQNHDLDAVSAVAAATEPRVLYYAREAARGDAALADDLAQDGRLAVWSGLDRFSGDTVGEFFSYVNTTLRGTVSNHRQSYGREGVTRAATERFEAAVSIAKGDTAVAERIVQDAEVMGGQFRTLSADLARSARLAYQGASSVDAAHEVESTYGVPEEDAAVVRPRVGRGAVVIAARTLADHLTVPADSHERVTLLGAMTALSRGEAAEHAVSALEDAVRVPRGSAERKAVLGALGILRSAVSTATDGELPEDLMQPGDTAADARAVTVGRVRRVLKMLSEQRRVVLSALTGVSPVPQYEDDASLSADYGWAVKAIKVARYNGKRQFRELWAL